VIMKPTDFWTLAGLIVIGWILVDVLSAPAANTSAAFSGVTNLVGTTGSLVTGKSASAPKSS